MGAHDPAAGKSFSLLVGVAFLEAEAGEDDAGARFEGVINVVVVLGRLEGLAGGGDSEDGLVAGRGGFLRQVTEVGATLPFDRASVGPLFAEDEPEEGGFTRAVGADKTEPVGARDKQ